MFLFSFGVWFSSINSKILKRSRFYMLEKKWKKLNGKRKFAVYSFVQKTERVLKLFFFLACPVSDFNSFKGENITFCLRNNKSSEIVIKVRVFRLFGPVFRGLQLRQPHIILGHDQPTDKDPFSAKKKQIWPIFIQSIHLNIFSFLDWSSKFLLIKWKCLYF